MEFHMTENGFATETAYGELHASPDDQYGFRPFQLMVASIVSCSGSVLRGVLTKMRLDFSDIKIFVKVERNAEKVNRIEKLRLHFVIHGTELRKEKVQRAVSLARKNCAMLQSVTDSISVIESFELIE